MTDTPTPSVALRTAQGIGLTAPAFAAGMITSLSVLTIPAIKSAPASLATTQWHQVYTLGKSTLPPLAVLSAAIWGVLAYNEPKPSPSTKLYAAAAAIMPLIVPYTVFVMEKTNAELTRLALLSGLSVAAEHRTGVLLDKWARLNVGRAVILLVGTGVAGYAVFRRGEGRKVSA